MARSVRIAAAPGFRASWMALPNRQFQVHVWEPTTLTNGWLYLDSLTPSDLALAVQGLVDGIRALHRQVLLPDADANEPSRPGAN